MWVDANGSFITQRRRHKLQGNRGLGFPGMSTIHVERDGEHSVQLSAAGMRPLSVCLEPRTEVDCTLFTMQVPGMDLGAAAGAWFDELVGIMGSRLVASTNQQSRWPVPGVTQFENSFADTGAVLLTSEGSLAQVNDWRRERGQSAVEMDRFRPNLVLSGTVAWEEDGWLEGKVLQIGRARFSVLAPCSRCSMITIEQSAGVPDNSTGANSLPSLLRKHRPSEAKRGLGTDQSPEFGLHVTPLNSCEIEVGDKLTVLDVTD
eukprot:TRINITY_DN44526_c0_g1_i1.p1 TRINITY_DN44526_c0_g1~~TRINITY_DN44526_c0_g1_i1.p1  ORF type:complete len:261 (-),score=50.47 TRINITY_DN44526_c0_g1_i1:65-847(-)